jgi:Asp/Glu/hydantoin racemase
MTRIIIELEGGLVTEVYCSDPTADVSVIDRDVLKEDGIESEEEERAWIQKAEQEIKEKGLTAVYS